MDYNELTLKDLERQIAFLEKEDTKERERAFMLHTGEAGRDVFDQALFAVTIAPYISDIYPNIEDNNNFYGKKADINEALYPYNSDFIQLFEKIRLYIDELQ